MIGVTAIAQKLVNNLLRAGKSEGRRRDALRFFDDSDLLMLRGKNAELLSDKQFGLFV